MSGDDDSTRCNADMRTSETGECRPAEGLTGDARRNSYFAFYSPTDRILLPRPEVVK